MSLASVNGLQMYYEVHGSGPPLLLLHGGLTTIDTSVGTLIPHFSKTRQVIAPEQQAHGHTADIDRPLSFEQMADDTATLLRHLGIKRTDVFGYSAGGNVALGLTIRHSDLVQKVAVASTHFNSEGMYPQILEGLKNAQAERMPSVLRDAYQKVAPKPDDWPKLVEKVAAQARAYGGWSHEDLRGIRAPALVMVGDADIVRPEHAVELFRLLPNCQLAVLPRTDHRLRLQNPEWVVSMLAEFLVNASDQLDLEFGKSRTDLTP
jgi:pimeloyl-ACP methyl ester carboxylesterase